MSLREIVSVTARQVYTMRGHPGVEATVVTRGGAKGVALCTSGISVGVHEVPFCLDGGPKWGGRGVTKAVDNVNRVIAPKLVGMDASEQFAVDSALLEIFPDAKRKLGGNAIAAVSAAVLKAGAASLGLPLYRHIGGENAMYLPVPGVHSVVGHERYGGGISEPGGKPSYSFTCFDFESYSEASYAAWEVQQLWQTKMKAMGIDPPNRFDAYVVPEGHFESDEELWKMMAETIAQAGYEGRIGIQMDVAANCYYDAEAGLYRGLFSRKDKTTEELMELYRYAVSRYPFVIIEDPFHEEDYESHARLTCELDIQVVGDDLFTTDPARLAHGAALGAANTVLLKVNQIGTISEAFQMIQLAYRLGYGVMPCESRGEGEAIADYCVGINAGSIRETAVGMLANRLLAIESELGPKARFAGRQGLKGRRFAAGAGRG